MAKILLLHDLRQCFMVVSQWSIENSVGHREISFLGLASSNLPLMVIHVAGGADHELAELLTIPGHQFTRSRRLVQQVVSTPVDIVRHELIVGLIVFF